MSEIELKVLIDRDAADKLKARAKSLTGMTRLPRARTLRSIYMDTEDHALRAAGIALRLRRDGRTWRQTVKSKSRMTGGLSQTGEVEITAPGGKVSLQAIPDPELRAEIQRRVNGHALEPVFETVMKRTASEITLEDGSRAELAIDVGEIKAEKRTAAFSEAEIELLEGSPEALFDLAAKLFPDGGMRFSTMSKAARGYLLAETGKIEAPLEPRTAKRVPLAPDMTVERAGRDVLRECTDQIVRNVSVVRGNPDPEGPHQLRIGLRRLRSAFLVFKPIFQCATLDRLSEEAKWLGGQVGRLRDLDVARDEIVAPALDQQAGEAGFSALDRALKLRQTAMRKEIRSVLESPRTQAFLLDLTCFVETRGWFDPKDLEQTPRLARPMSNMASDAMEKRWLRVCKKARRIDQLDISARHALRKELKKLRYAVEFLAPLFKSKRVRPFVKRLKRLQNVFGDLNDLAMAEAMFLGPDAPCRSDPVAQRAVGFLIGASQGRSAASWVDAKHLWLDLRSSDRFWA